MNKKGLSFNASFGPILGLIIIVFVYSGIRQQYTELFLIAGYLSIFTGIVLLLNTLFTNAYIGTIMAPIMWTCMIALVLLGIVLVYQPFNDFVREYFSNFEIFALYSYITIFLLAIVHIITGK